MVVPEVLAAMCYFLDRLHQIQNVAVGAKLPQEHSSNGWPVNPDRQTMSDSLAVESKVGIASSSRVFAQLIHGDLERFRNGCAERRFIHNRACYRV